MANSVYVLEVAVEALSSAENAWLETSVGQARQQIADFALYLDHESGQFTLRGTDERHLAEIRQAIATTMSGRVRFGAPQVIYLETLSRSVTVDYTYKKQTGGAGRFARVIIEFTPLQPGSGYLFGNDVAGGAIPDEFIQPVDRGIRAQKDQGLVTGFPVVDFMARLVDGRYHEVDSTALTFEIAGRGAFRELASKNAAQLLEPVMAVDVATPDVFLGRLIGDLNSRRGHIRSSFEVCGEYIVKATVPLANLIGYEGALASMTQSRARCTMRFDRYEPLSGLPGGDPNFPVAIAMRVA